MKPTMRMVGFCFPVGVFLPGVASAGWIDRGNPGKEVRGVKWGSLKLRIVYAVMLIASLALAAGANAKWS